MLFVFSCISVAFAQNNLSAVSSVGIQRQYLRADPYQQFRFKHIKPEAVSEIGEVRGIVQDSQGFIWSSGNGGLLRFDGLEVKHYRHKPVGQDSPSSNEISALHIDKSGDFWLATSLGLNYYNKDTETFTLHLSSNDENNRVRRIYETSGGELLVSSKRSIEIFDRNTTSFSNYLPENITSALKVQLINDVFEDSRGIIWIATELAGVGRFDPKNKTYSAFKHRADNVSLSDNRVHCIEEDRFGYLWFGTENGLSRFDPSDESFSNFRHVNSDENSLAHNVIYDILETIDGRLWIGTDGGGLNLFNRQNNNFVRVVTSLEDDSSLASNHIRTLYEDNDGNLWVGHQAAGISLLDRKASVFQNYRYHSQEPTKSLSHPSVNAVVEDKVGNLWVGTPKGLDFIDVKRGLVESITFENRLDAVGEITTLLQLKEGELLVGTKKGELLKFNTNTRTWRDFDKPTPGAEAPILSLYKDSVGELWIAKSDGLFIVNDAETKKVPLDKFAAGASKLGKSDKSDKPGNLDSEKVYHLYEDNHNSMWVSAGVGLYQLSLDAELRNFYSLDQIAVKEGNASRVTQVVSGTDDFLWVGTEGVGVSKLDYTSGIFENFRLQDGLSNNNVRSLVLDESKNLWIGTTHGISRLNTKTIKFKNFNQQLGLPGNHFNDAAVLKSRIGDLVFGSKSGLSVFNPSLLVDDGKAPTINLSELLVLNKPVDIDEESALQSSIVIADSIQLTSEQSIFTLAFVGIDYLQPKSVQYAYRLKGFNDEWLYVGDRRRATYTNLDPGEYVFEVKSANARGIWNDKPKTLKIRVLPAWWKSWWAYAFYVVSVVGVMCLFIFNFSHKRQADKERELNQKLLQVDKLKDEFLANTSHELRTPLNGIIGLSESLIEGIEGELSKPVISHLQIIVNSGKRLANLVNDILDFSRLREHTISLDKKAVDLHQLSNIVVNLSKPLLGDNAIVLINDVSEDLPALHADEDRLQQILFNLIGNAIKFTEHGSVKISAEREGNFVWVIVRDTGAGISESSYDNVFEAFQQTDEANGEQYGTGLGLAVTKQLVELHGGRIEFVSKVDEGTTFRFCIPCFGEHDLTSPVSELSGNKSPEFQAIDASVQPVVNADNSMHFPTGQEVRYHILIVDDEPVNRQVLINLLTLKQFQVTECSSGIEALKLMDRMSDYIDLILLDVMMPGLSGYEVCQALRKKFSAHRLPVLFLTAKNQVVDLEAGYAVGANDYLTKPIIKEELLARVNTHLELLEVGRSLEQTVIERTAELTQSHEELKASLEQLKCAQSQLVQTEKLSSLGTLVAGIGHELNNPAHFTDVATGNLESEIESFKQFILTIVGDDAEEEIRHAFEERFIRLSGPLSTIKGGVERIGAIVGNLRNFSRVEVTVADPEHLKANLESTLSLVKVNFKDQVEFVTELKGDPLVKCLPSELNQVFMNLMVNACQAIVEKQKTIEDSSPGMLLIKMYEEGSDLVIEFHDSGAGMPQDVLEHIFEPFFTTKPSGVGTGLGLSISYDIVKRNGGMITAKSEAGEGTVFVLRFPIYNPETDVAAS